MNNTEVAVYDSNKPPFNTELTSKKIKFSPEVASAMHDNLC